MRDGGAGKGAQEFSQKERPLFLVPIRNTAQRRWEKYFTLRSHNNLRRSDITITFTEVIKLIQGAVAAFRQGGNRHAL